MSFSIGRDVIELVNRVPTRHGTILLQVPSQGRGRRWSVRWLGRPNNRGVPQGPPSDEEANERDAALRPAIAEGMDSLELATANAELKKALELDLSQAERASLRAEKVTERDNPGSTDHEIYEAIRYIDAIDEIDP